MGLSGGGGGDDDGEAPTGLCLWLLPNTDARSRNGRCGTPETFSRRAESL